MVMHARKTQRIGDGYFEKHQTHPYQNSKYSSKSSYDRERMRERDSPNGNAYRSDSPECDSPRDRSSSYHSKSLYVSKSRDKERENRDYKSRDKYSDCVNRSPKDKRLRESRETEHRTNHDRNSTEKNDSHTLKLSQNSSRDSQRKLSSSCQDKREERDRVARCGDWSEHISSSGKKYYYNCKTEVSQWEKPREWVDPRPPPPPQPQRHLYPPLQQNRTVLEKHSMSNNSRKGGGVGSVGSGQRDKLPPTSSGSNYWPGVQHHDSHSSNKLSSDLPNNSGVDGEGTDMEICSGDSTPTSETSGAGQQDGANAPGPPHQQPLHVDTLPVSADPGPPTPTHSETQDCTDARKLTSPSSSLLSAGTALAGLRPQAPNLTPSLANHYRDDLVNHVRGWPADLLEKQAQKLSEEAHQLGAMCTRVSAELKCARSVVRLTEIQATLQEQRVMFLQQQIKNLEDLKSQNSFMADEP